MIDVEAVQYTYPRFTLGPQTWSLASGARCAIVGANGAGKTTLLSILAGQLPPSAGDVRIAGTSVARDPIAIRARVALVADKLLCCPWMTAEEHFRLQSRFFKTWNTAVAREAAAVLSLPLDKKLTTLSRGTSLKVAICCALAQQASLLLLDEPTAGLDPVARIDFLRMLRAQLADRPELTVIFATHILEDLDDLDATDLIVLDRGVAHVVDVGTSGENETVGSLARRHLLGLARPDSEPGGLEARNGGPTASSHATSSHLRT